MCVAMTWPPNPTVNQRPILENVRQDVTSGIVHGDIHNGNGKTISNDPPNILGTDAA